MRAITLTQPWATLVAIGAKCIETRSWSTPYRGPIAIHAAKGFPLGAQNIARSEPFASVLREAGFISPSELPRGSVVATARLVDVLPIQSKPAGGHCVAPDDEGLMRVWHPTELAGVKGHYSDITTEHEALFGDYSTPGRFGWVLEGVEALPAPVPARGALGLWTWQP
jgi:hypothetical protein